AFILYLLFADLAPARHHRGVIRFRRVAMHQTARAVFVVVVLIDGERVPVWVRHRVEVVEVAEKFVEAMQRRQELVQVAEVVLTELACSVALCFERGGDGASLGRHADISTRLADGRETCADRQLTGDEVRATRRATRFSVIVGEEHTLRRQLVEVWRFAGHDPAVVGTNVKPANVVSHDEDDVGFLVRRLGWSNHAEKRSRGHKQRQAVVTYVLFHFGFLVIWFWVCSHDSSPIVQAMFICWGEAGGPFASRPLSHKYAPVSRYCPGTLFGFLSSFMTWLRL